MPVDIHPEERVPGVELILTRLHAGAKFSERNYRFAAGSTGSECQWSMPFPGTWKCGSSARAGIQHVFANGEKRSDLEPIDTVGRRNTGTRLRFWPDPGFFDFPPASPLRVSSTRCEPRPSFVGSEGHICDEGSDEQESWQYEEG